MKHRRVYTDSGQHEGERIMAQAAALADDVAVTRRPRDARTQEPFQPPRTGCVSCGGRPRFMDRTLA